MTLWSGRFEGGPSEQLLAYTVSLGIFDPNGSLKKWFNTIATFAISGGALTTPHVDTLTTELGCGAS